MLINLQYFANMSFYKKKKEKKFFCYKKKEKKIFFYCKKKGKNFFKKLDD